MSIIHDDIVSYLRLLSEKCEKKLQLTDVELTRFCSKIDTTISASAGATDCWLWMAGCEDDNYGVFWLRRKQHRASRIMHRIAIGPIPEGHQVCHICDTPSCVNPSHIFCGTPMDNSKDMVSKGRSFKPAGALHPMAKLSPDKVIEIRTAWSSRTQTQRHIASRYGVSQSEVSMIVTGKKWRAST